MTRPAVLPTRTLQQAADFLRTCGYGVELAGEQRASGALTGISIDSRSSQPGDLWLAVPGRRSHGAAHVEAALQRNVAAVVTDADGLRLLLESRITAPIAVVDGPADWVGPLSAWFFDHPGRSLRTVGVTGTNGKTSVTYFLASALAAATHAPAASIGTLGVLVRDGESSELAATGFTTPEAPVLHSCLAALRQRGVGDVALEISSHALALGRVDGLTVDLAVFTNLSRDHLDLHGDMDSYFTAKARLFDSQHSKQALVCVDDEWGSRLADDMRAAGRAVTTYGRSDSDVQLLSADGQRVTVAQQGSLVEFPWSIPGDFNAVNAVAVYAALRMLGYDAAEGVAAMSAIRGAPGRMEVVSESGQPLTVVDYAHSPDSVSHVLSAVRSLAPGRLIVVMGAGGDRDKDKRRAMGAAASSAGADMIIITDDNPRTEDPKQIRDAIRSGIEDSSTAAPAVVEIADRADAIAHAISCAAAADIVAVLGKGAEPGQHFATHVAPFDDRQVARSCLRMRAEQRGRQ